MQIIQNEKNKIATIVILDYSLLYTYIANITTTDEIDDYWNFANIIKRKFSYSSTNKMDKKANQISVFVHISMIVYY